MNLENLTSYESFHKMPPTLRIRANNTYLCPGCLAFTLYAEQDGRGKCTECGASAGDLTQVGRAAELDFVHGGAIKRWQSGQAVAQGVERKADVADDPFAKSMRRGVEDHMQRVQDGDARRISQMDGSARRAQTEIDGKQQIFSGARLARERAAARAAND